MSNKQLIFVDLASDWGGGQVSLLTMLRQMRDLGWTNFIYTPEASALSTRAAQEAFHILTARSSGAFAKLVAKDLRRRPYLAVYSAAAVVAEAVNLVRIVRSIRPAVIHSNNLKAALVSGLVSKVTGIPHVWHDRTQNMNLAYRIARSGSDRVIAISRWVGTKHKHNPKVKVIHNGVDIDAFQGNVSPRLKEELGLRSSSFVIGVMSRLTRWKGLDVMIKALALVLSITKQEITLVIVGDEQIERGAGERERLEALVRELGLAGHVIFAGFRSDIPECIHSFDLVVIPSVQPEPFGRVAIEAMAAGKPVVASNTGGLSEIVQDGITGRLVVPGSPSDLATVISELMQDLPKLAEMGLRSRERAAASFSAEAHGREMDSLFRSLVR